MTAVTPGTMRTYNYRNKLIQVKGAIMGYSFDEIPCRLYYILRDALGLCLEGVFAY